MSTTTVSKKIVKIKKGLNIPLDGEPAPTIENGAKVKRVAILGDDFPNMKPRFLLKEGDKVSLGTPIFTDRKNESIIFTSPGSGKIIEINRGEKRVFQSCVIELDDKNEEKFKSYSASDIERLDAEKVKDNLLKSGEWIALRERPLDKVADPEHTPVAVFITVTDTNPLAAPVSKVMEGQEQDLVNGVKVLSRLSSGNTYVAKNSSVSLPDMGKGINVVDFEGPHPAGLAGTHIHFLDPAGPNRHVWYVNYQDAIAIGKLFTTGKISVDRIVSLAGPSVRNPRLIRTRIGASIDELTANQLTTDKDKEIRVIAGSALHGHHATGPFAYVARYKYQITAIPELVDREFFGSFTPGFNKFSVLNLVFSKLMPGKKFRMNTSLNGSHRAVIPLGTYEKVMPLDIYPTHLLRSLLSDDIEKSEELGCLELGEEDLALCSYVSPGKEEFGQVLRQMLNRIEKEG